MLCFVSVGCILQCLLLIRAHSLSHAALHWTHSCLCYLYTGAAVRFRLWQVNEGDNIKDLYLEANTHMYPQWVPKNLLDTDYQTIGQGFYYLYYSVLYYIVCFYYFMLEYYEWVLLLHLGVIVLDYCCVDLDSNIYGLHVLLVFSLRFFLSISLLVNIKCTHLYNNERGMAKFRPVPSCRSGGVLFINCYSWTRSCY